MGDLRCCGNCFMCGMWFDENETGCIDYNFTLPAHKCDNWKPIDPNIKPIPYYGEV